MSTALVIISIFRDSPSCPCPLGQDSFGSHRQQLYGVAQVGQSKVQNTPMFSPSIHTFGGNDIAGADFLRLVLVFKRYARFCRRASHSSGSHRWYASFGLDLSAIGSYCGIKTASG